MPWTPPPRGLRIVHLPDRLILHDLTFSLSHAHPSSRNALIDAANAVHANRRSTASFASPTLPNLLDLDDHAATTSTAAGTAVAVAEASASDVYSPSLTSPPPPTSHPPAHRYLVLPFADVTHPHEPPPPFATGMPNEAGFPGSPHAVSPHVDVAAAFLGLLPLHTAMFAVFATQVRHAADLPSGPVLSVTKVSLLPLSPSAAVSKDDKDAIPAVIKQLESGSLYYSPYVDLSRPSHAAPSKKRPFQWNFPLASRLPVSMRAWLPVCIYGFVTTRQMNFRPAPDFRGQADFQLTLISRRSRRRAGTRFITRGVDAMGDVANFVETEQLVWRDRCPSFASFIVIRGSIPVFWLQNNGIARPAPELHSGLVPSRLAFTRHFDALRDTYSHVCAVSLVDKHGSERVLAQAFERHLDLYLHSPNCPDPHPSLVAFDFHTYCAGKEYERGLAMLMDRLRDDVDSFAFYANLSGEVTRVQNGVFRVNCVDCLDRTNVVQSMISRAVLGSQLKALFGDASIDVSPTGQVALFTESEDRFKHVWGDNADAISKQYSGTGALKTDFTRTGKRSTSGVIGDGMKSVMRMYYKNFVDEGRQEVIDILCGNAIIRQQASSPSLEASKSGSATGRIEPSHSDRVPTFSQKSSPSPSSSLWYSFEAHRINAGGDKQSVFVELYDEIMYVTTVEGITFEYPRRALTSWSKFDDGKTTDRRAPAKLRLLYKPSYTSPATTFPLDLQFRGGTNMRENFLRSLVSWAKPGTAGLLTPEEMRVRVLTARHAGEHRLEDWGIDAKHGAEHTRQVIALVVPECNATSRPCGLAAVPVDVDTSDLVVLSAFAASERGPALAVLGSRDVAESAMSVDEAVWCASGSFSAGGVAGVALQICGASFCFLGARIDSADELSAALMHLRLGRPSFECTMQFDHFVLAGTLGNMRWGHSNGRVERGDERKWSQSEEGSLCYSLANGLSVMRYSLPTLRYEDRLNAQSFWKVGTKPSRNAQAIECICVADGIVEGRRGPQLPKRLSQCVVHVSDVRGEDVKMPRGVEHASQMNCSLVVHCEYGSVDTVCSRPCGRATTCPEWKERLEVPMIASDAEEVFNGFVMGQIVVGNPLGDGVVAGNFVIPLSVVRDGAVGFDVRCRLGGVMTGRVVGRVGVDVRRCDGRSDGGMAMVDSRAEEGMVAAVDGEDRLASARSRVGGSSSQKGGMDDVNERLEAARRKGAKQVKSVVNRLSSFLNQPSGGSSGGVERSARIRSENFGEGRNGIRVVSNSERDVDQLEDEQWAGGSSAWKRASAPAAGMPNPNVGVPATLGERRDGRAAKGVTPGGPRTEVVVKESENVDGLLLGLTKLTKLSGRDDDGVDSGRAVPAHVSDGNDLLLSGLAAMKGNGKKPASAKASSVAETATAVVVDEDVDGWGDFESAQSSSTRRDNTKSKRVDDLIDW